MNFLIFLFLCSSLNSDCSLVRNYYLKYPDIKHNWRSHQIFRSQLISCFKRNSVCSGTKSPKHPNEMLQIQLRFYSFNNYILFSENIRFVGMFKLCMKVTEHLEISGKLYKCHFQVWKRTQTWIKKILVVLISNIIYIISFDIISDCSVNLISMWYVFVDILNCSM